MYSLLYFLVFLFGFNCVIKGECLIEVENKDCFKCRASERMNESIKDDPLPNLNKENLPNTKINSFEIKQEKMQLDPSLIQNKSIDQIKKIIIQHITTNETLSKFFVNSNHKQLKIQNLTSENAAKKNCYIIQLDEKTPDEYINELISLYPKIGGIVNAKYDQILKGIYICFDNPNIDNEVLNFLTTLPFVKMMERSTNLSVNVEQINAPWQLDRLDQEELPLDNIFQLQYTGKGVDIYFLDSGIDVEHAEFDDRVKLGFSIYDKTEDVCGHGTQVVSLALGRNVGVAKQANGTMIQILDENGEGTTADMLIGLEWILNNSKNNKPNIINMSIGGNKSKAINTAIKTCLDLNYIIITAAGNSNDNACNYSPTCTDGVVSVGASTKNDERALYSNYGKCVSLFAPGSNVLVATPKYVDGKGYKIVSGTSMSAPLVSGVVATLIEKYEDFNSKKIVEKLIEMANKGVLKKSGLKMSPNLLLRSINEKDSNRNVDLVFDTPVIMGDPTEVNGLMNNYINIYLNCLVFSFMILCFVCF